MDLENVKRFCLYIYIYIYTCLSSVPFFGMGWLEFRGGSRRLPRKKTAETFLSLFLIVSLMIWFVDEQNMSTSRMMEKEPGTGVFWSVVFCFFCSFCWEMLHEEFEVFTHVPHSPHLQRWGFCCVIFLSTCRQVPQKSKSHKQQTTPPKVGWLEHEILILNFGVLGS